MDFLRIGKIFAQDYYAVPDYQRDYEWTNSQNATLIDDVIQLARDSHSTNHFFGAIVTIPYENGTGINKSIDFNDYGIDAKQNVKHVVDGQQRLTSFSVLIRVLRDLIVEDVTISQTFKDNVAQRQLDNILLGNDYLGINPAPRLILNGNTGACYNNEVLKISSNVYSKVLKGAKRLLAAYTLFKTELLNGLLEFVNEGFCQTSEEYYSKIITTLTNKITFVEIECDASSDAFQVFDSLNGKGLDLTAADRIKNIFMSWSPHGKGAQKWDALVSDIGEDYLANFFVSLFFYHTQKRVAKNHLPEEFRNVYKESANADFDFFFNDLKKAGMLYGSLRKANTLNYTVNNIITDFRALNMDQVYVILFAVAKHYGDTAFNNNEYQEFAKILQMLIVRMQVCEKSMNKLDSLFANCIDAMKTKAAPISLIIQKLKDEMKSTVDDAQFESAFAKFSPNDNKVAEFYLRHIENQIRKEKGNRSPVERGLTVEHIIPQSLYDLKDWYGTTAIPEDIVEDFKQNVVENIGNKALLYGDDNSAAGNNDYAAKLNIYNNGKCGQNMGTPINSFELIQDLVNNNSTTFIRVDVAARAQRLAKYALKIW